MTARFLICVGRKEFVVYADGPSSASALVARHLGLPSDMPVPGATLQPAGWWDPKGNAIVGAPDSSRIEYGVAWRGAAP